MTRGYFVKLAVLFGLAGGLIGNIDIPVFLQVAVFALVVPLMARATYKMWVADKVLEATVNEWKKEGPTP